MAFGLGFSAAKTLPPISNDHFLLGQRHSAPERKCNLKLRSTIYTTSIASSRWSSKHLTLSVLNSIDNKLRLSCIWSAREHCYCKFKCNRVQSMSTTMAFLSYRLLHVYKRNMYSNFRLHNGVAVASAPLHSLQLFDSSEPWFSSHL